jgi:hypothetical protein
MDEPASVQAAQMEDHRSVPAEHGPLARVQGLPTRSTSRRFGVRQIGDPVLCRPNAGRPGSDIAVAWNGDSVEPESSSSERDR